MSTPKHLRQVSGNLLPILSDRLGALPGDAKQHSDVLVLLAPCTHRGNQLASDLTNPGVGFAGSLGVTGHRIEGGGNFRGPLDVQDNRVGVDVLYRGDHGSTHRNDVADPRCSGRAAQRLNRPTATGIRGHLNTVRGGFHAVTLTQQVVASCERADAQTKRHPLLPAGVNGHCRSGATTERSELSALPGRQQQTNRIGVHR